MLEWRMYGNGDESEELKLLRLAVDHIRDGIHILDRDGYTLFINEAAKKYEGFDEEVVRGKTIYQLIEEGILSESVMVKVLRERKSTVVMQTVKSGREMMAEGTPIFDEEGEIEKVVVTSRDVSEINRVRRAMIESERKREATMDKMREVSMIDDLPENIVGGSNEMRSVIRTAQKVAKVDSNVMIYGESGTGKGVISRFIHDNSNRREKPFIVAECSSLPESLFESEMFGYDSGAFTGASKKGRLGLMELASGGTLFLDEIGELSLNCQAKLLRAIQDKVILPVGGEEFRRINVRIISATNRNLKDMVSAGTFREDLFYRLDVVPITVPPLREHKSDIKALINKAVSRINAEYSIEKKVITSDVLPSSVKLSLLKKFSIRPGGGTLRDMLDDYEKAILREYVTMGYVPNEIAAELGVDSTTIRRKLHKYRIRFK